MSWFDPSVELYTREIIVQYVSENETIPNWMDSGNVTAAYQAVTGKAPDLGVLESGEAIWKAAHEAAKKAVSY